MSPSLCVLPKPIASYLPPFPVPVVLGILNPKAISLLLISLGKKKIPQPSPEGPFSLRPFPMDGIGQRCGPPELRTTPPLNSCFFLPLTTPVPGSLTPLLLASRLLVRRANTAAAAVTTIAGCFAHQVLPVHQKNLQNSTK